MCQVPDAHGQHDAIVSIGLGIHGPDVIGNGVEGYSDDARDFLSRFSRHQQPKNCALPWT